MILLVSGILLIALGLFSGGVLVAAPLGWVTAAPDMVLWVLFPVFSVAGYILFVIGSRDTQIRGLSLAVSCLLLLLALAAATALVLSAASVVPRIGNALSLWYVLAVAGVLGIAGAASFGSAAREP